MSDLLPSSGPIRVAVDRLGSAFFVLGYPGYFDRVRGFLQYYELEGLTDDLRAPAFDQVLASARQVPAVWTKAVRALVKSAVQTLIADRAHVAPGQEHALREAIREVVATFGANGLLITEDGEIQSTEPTKFITECIFCDCEAAPIRAGDIQINEVVGALHGLRPGARIVDIGAGRGRVLPELVTIGSFGEAHYVGLNVDPQDHAALERLIEELGLPNAEAVRYSEADAVVETAQFVLCLNVLHALSIEEAAGLIQQESRLLALGGTLVIHDFGLPRAGGERRLVPWDAEAGARLVEGWCATSGGRDFVSRSGTELWTVVGEKLRDCDLDGSRIMRILEGRKQRLLHRRRGTTDATERVLLSEFNSNLDDRVEEFRQDRHLNKDRS